MVEDLLRNIVTASSQSCTKVLQVNIIDTPIGQMVAMGDEEHLWLLEFIDRKNFSSILENFRKRIGATFVQGDNRILSNIRRELVDYFSKKRSTFQTPIKMFGSEFQKLVWRELLKINAGETRSYSDIAMSINKPNAYRAVANANASNRIAVIIPCHRVIGADKSLAGYAGGIERKKSLIEHEKNSYIL
jgi:AraC family transcriptional regulator of adaptative response/methylated-DNA-[protein]-cysteine methyltransferase